VNAIKTFSEVWPKLDAHTEAPDAFSGPLNATLPVHVARAARPQRGLSEADFRAAAKSLGLGNDVAGIKAVAAIESRQEGFNSNGKAKILFERHWYHKLTGGKYASIAPHLSNPKPGGYGTHAEQYAKLEAASQLDEKSALMSASWGRFQIMGINYKRAGFIKVSDFVNAMQASEANHLKAFVSFIKSDSRIHKALKSRNWAAFARAYNGPAYKQNQYDTKLQAAYASFAPQPLKTKVRA
jgi:hypothetical protein